MLFEVESSDKGASQDIEGGAGGSSDERSDRSEQKVIKRKATPKRILSGVEEHHVQAATDYVNGLFSRMMPEDEEGTGGVGVSPPNDSGEPNENGDDEDGAPGDGIFDGVSSPHFKGLGPNVESIKPSESKA